MEIKESRQIDINKAIKDLKIEEIFNDDNFIIGIITNSNEFKSFEIHDEKDRIIFNMSMHYIENNINGHRFTQLRVYYNPYGVRYNAKQIIDIEDKRCLDAQEFLKFLIAHAADYIRVNRLC